VLHGSFFPGEVRSPFPSLRYHGLVEELRKAASKPGEPEEIQVYQGIS
jgi:hypothetical protein